MNLNPAELLNPISNTLDSLIMTTFHSRQSGDVRRWQLAPFVLYRAENIFKRVAVELDGEPVRGGDSHRELLLRMKTPLRTDRRYCGKNSTTR
jgi:hypothetical protein